MLSAGLAAGAGDRTRYGFAPPASATDVTWHFRSFFVGEQLSPALVDAAFDRVRDALRGVRIIIVPSYLVDLIRPVIAVGLVDYFSEQRQWLQRAGIATEFAPVNSEASVASNAAAIADQIARSQTPLCILSHSKGGVDTLAALTALSSEHLARVRCWITLQAPFAGTPIADMAARSPLRPLVDLALLLVAGSPRSLDDMTTPVRLLELTDADAAVQRVTTAVPTLAVTTVLPATGGFWPHSLFDISRGMLADRGIESDGVVPTGSAILPHARFVVIDGLNHGDLTALDCPQPCRFGDDALLLKALLAITLAQQ